MTTPGTVRRRYWLGAAAGLGLLGVVASGFAPPTIIDLIGRGREHWTEYFGAGREEAVVQVAHGDDALPPILPGPADEWAGRKAHRIAVHFVAPRRQSRLLLRIAGAHEMRPVLFVSVNGLEIGRLPVRPEPAGRQPHQTRAPPSSYRIEIPAAVLDAGGNQTLTIENRQGAWVLLAGLQVLDATPTFSPAHFLTFGPPPRPALLALGVALLALWIADPRAIRERRPELLLLVGGLAMLALLAVPRLPLTGVAAEGTLRSFLEWKLLASTRRVIWLLLALGVLAVLAPGLPRLSVPRLLRLTAFVTGAMGMVLELVAFRLVSPFFGYSLYVWGAVVGVVMAALAVGYWLGGRLADRWSSPRVLFGILSATALATLVALSAYPGIVRLSVTAPLVAGSLLAALLLCFLPMAGLGLTAPFVIRCLAAPGRLGVTAGQIYAVSTAGGVVGTLATAFFLIRILGPSAAWAVAGLLLLLLSAYGLACHWDRRALRITLLLSAVLVLAQPSVPEISVAALKGGVRLYATESEYSHLEIIEVERFIEMVPQLHFTHTIYDQGTILEPSVADGLLPSFLTEPRTAVVLGMGGGTLTRVYLHVHPALRIDGVDIDRETIRLGKRFLGLREDPRLTIFVEDARVFLARRPQARYDLALVDLWQGGVFIPYYTVTREFFAMARERLTETGVLSLIVGTPPNLELPHRQESYDRLVKTLGNTLAMVFPSVFSYPAGDYAYHFVATRQPMSRAEVEARLRSVAIPELRQSVRTAVRKLKEYEPQSGIPILSDDLAPVDQLIYDAFFRQ